MATLTTTPIELKTPVNIMSKHYINNRPAYYTWLREEAPVHKGKFSLMNMYYVSRYHDCVAILKDPRVIRNRTTITGGSRLPFPLPKSVALVANSMIIEDDPEHRRLRNLVHKAFTPRAIENLGKRIDSLTHELLDKAEAQGQANLQEAYSLPIPVTVISEMMGIDPNDTPQFSGSLRALSSGMSGLNIIRTFLFDMPKSIKFMKELIARKRQDPGDDIFTALIQAEEDGETLNEDELISMAFLIIIAGYETTVHLINNCVVTLAQHPDQLQRLRDNPDLMESAIEEVLRFNGPIRGTKIGYPTEDITLHGVTIPKGASIMPILGAANHDPEAFENPEIFDIARTPNRHLGFGQGIHYCLGAPLARLETKIALTNLLNRNPNLRLAIPANELEVAPIPAWQRYKAVPVIFG